ncbi:MAG: 4-hydroxythreonine-4-phosphate dehydrogenase PdxA [Methylotetracoccus sp.]
MARRPHILLTTGEPGGIGPDLLIALSGRDLGCRVTVVGDPDLLRSRGQRMGQTPALREFEPGTADDGAVGLSVWQTRAKASDTCGRAVVENARYVLETIERGTRACLQGYFDALVTPPVHKGVINDAGFPFSGHTEYIAAITGGAPVMMLAIPGLRVALATTHLPLAEVSRALTRESLETVIRVLVRDLTVRFALPRPRVLVLGLNPHAGEGGHLGREELELIIPLLERLRGDGLDLVGPLPADTAFLPKYLESADAVLAMYHDQGLPVLKHAGFGRAVNVTLGLPIIRTSVDHGTALELAGSGTADPGSLEAAIACAVMMATAGGGPGT